MNTGNIIDRIKFKYLIAENKLLKNQLVEIKHIKVISKIIENIEIVGMEVIRLYYVYFMMCRKENIKPKSQIDFSRFFLNWFAQYEIKNKRFGNKIHRVLTKAVQ